jgi:hypothetical protein
MTQANAPAPSGFQTYSLDRCAHDLVYQRIGQDKEVLNQAHKMRSTIAFGLERFWGEQHRLDGAKAQYWRDVWNQSIQILRKVGINLPNPTLQNEDQIKALWDLDREQRKIAIAIISELCDCVIWWTQRYK